MATGGNSSSEQTIPEIGPEPTIPAIGHNPSPQYNARSVRRAILYRRVTASVIGGILIGWASILILFLVLRPRLPEFRVDSLSFSQLSVDNHTLLSFQSKAELSANNVNKILSLHYHDIQAYLSCGSVPLAGTGLPSFSQSPGNEAKVAANFAALGTFVQGIKVDEKGNFKVSLKLFSEIRYEAKAFRSMKILLRVFCEDLTLHLSNKNTSGKLTGGPKQCRLFIKYLED